VRFAVLGNKLLASFLATIVSLALAIPSPAAPAQAEPSFTPEELDKIVSRIALYPDPLLAQILTASTFPDQIPEAAEWADEHHYLTGAELAEAIQADHLWWDPSVQALLPFPSVLDTMASDMDWTNDLGNAVLADRSAVMDAIQRMRRKAKEYGYLRSNEYITVREGPYIEIEPVNPDFIVVPAYDPWVVFAPPPPGFYVGGALRLASGLLSARGFALGAGELAVSAGASTPFSSTMFVGSVDGVIGVCTCTATRAFIATSGRTASNVTN